MTSVIPISNPRKNQLAGPINLKNLRLNSFIQLLFKVHDLSYHIYEFST